MKYFPRLLRSNMQPRATCFPLAPNKFVGQQSYGGFCSFFCKTRVHLCFQFLWSVRMLLHYLLRICPVTITNKNGEKKFSFTSTCFNGMVFIFLNCVPLLFHQSDMCLYIVHLTGNICRICESGNLRRRVYVYLLH